MNLNIKLDKNSNNPLYKQLADYLYMLIEAQELLPNQKLPTIRLISEKLNITTTTVVSAYKYLEEKKVIYSRRGSGFFVSPISIDKIPNPVFNENIAQMLRKPNIDENVINFTTTALPHSLFPTNEFKKAFDMVLDMESGGAFSSTHPQGYLPLREILCSYLETYSIKTSPENIQIISGAQQGIDIVSKSLLKIGDKVFVEKPTYNVATATFLSAGGEVIEIPLESDGIDVKTLENLAKLYRPKFLYLMAYFQTPTGISYSHIKKKKILELANKYDFYIIEDDNLYDFNYSKENIVPFKAMDSKNRVIYIKSFSKILMPGLRIGFCVLPKKIIESMTIAKYTTDISTSGFLQKALNIYLRENHWKAHISTIEDYGKNKYKLATKYTDRYLKEFVSYQKPKGGVGLWLDIKNVPIDNLIKKAYEKNVAISNGNRFYAQGNQCSFLRLSFINESDAKIESGIRRLGECLKHFTY